MTSQRKQDELILSAIRLRCRDIGSTDIATRLGCSPAYVRASTNRVKDADAKESHEDISEAYWDRPATGREDWKQWGRLPAKAVPTRPDRPLVSARFGGRIHLKSACPDTFGAAIDEADLAILMARSAQSEMQAFAMTFDEAEDYA